MALLKAFGDRSGANWPSGEFYQIGRVRRNAGTNYARKNFRSSAQVSSGASSAR